MLGEKPSTSSLQDAVSKSVNFELTFADMARRSERRAWWVAITAICTAIILALGYFFLLPLKEKVPYLVMADAYTGTSTVTRLSTDVIDQRISSSEALARSNVAHFVLARESYDVTLLNLRDWATVITMSAPDVAASYQNLYASLNPDNPYKVYGQNNAIRVNILSIVLIGGGDGQPYKGATVRFQRTLYNKQNGAVQPLDNKIATLAFAYKPNLQMAEKYRIENPLGFQVSSYRTDTDYATAPPPANAGPQQRRPFVGAQEGSTGGADASAMTTDSAAPMENSAMPPAQEGNVPVSSNNAAPIPKGLTQGVERR